MITKLVEKSRFIEGFPDKQIDQSEVAYNQSCQRDEHTASRANSQKETNESRHLTFLENAQNVSLFSPPSQSFSSHNPNNLFAMAHRNFGFISWQKEKYRHLPVTYLDRFFMVNGIWTEPKGDEFYSTRSRPCPNCKSMSCFVLDECNGPITHELGVARAWREICFECKKVVAPNQVLFVWTDEQRNDYLRNHPEHFKKSKHEEESRNATSKRDRDIEESDEEAAQWESVAKKKVKHDEPEPIAITFSSRCPLFGGLSTCSPNPITIDDVTYPTAEHYYQSQKFKDASYQEAIRKAETPRDAKILASQKTVVGSRGRWIAIDGLIVKHLKRGVKPRPDWNNIKENVMRRALKAKFNQSILLRVKLLNTGKSNLINRSEYDVYWGTGKDGKGKNRLGELLMELRKELSS